MKLPEFLFDHPDGEIRLVGTRIGLSHVVDLYNDGYKPEQIYEQFLSPSLEHIKQVIAYYEANRAEVDAYLEQGRALFERWLADYSPSLQKLKVRQLMDLFEQAEAQNANDPEWKNLSLGEKIQRLGLLEKHRGVASSQ
jgi:uncharacterized protein (DUF433 family)